MEKAKTLENIQEKPILNCNVFYIKRRCISLRFCIVAVIFVMVFISFLITSDAKNEKNTFETIAITKKSTEQYAGKSRLIHNNMFPKTNRKIIKKQTRQIRANIVFVTSQNAEVGNLKLFEKRHLYRKAVFYHRTPKPRKIRQVNYQQESKENKTGEGEDILYSAMTNFYLTKQSALNTNDTSKTAAQSNISSPAYFYAAAIKCQEYQNNCTLSCSDGTVSFLDENINEFKPKCPNMDLSLMVTKCEFNYGTLQQSFFHAASKMAYLSIIECNLQMIKTAAFQHANVKDLHTLILINNQLLTLQDNSFEGLINLINFQFVQKPLSTAVFKGAVFLKPLAIKLREAIIQPSVNAIEVIDPLNWWQDMKMPVLTKLDLSNTNLQGVLNSKTFQAFEKLEVLILFNCNLLQVKADIFDFVTNKFIYLDLRYNHLQTLDSEFLLKMALPEFEMNLSFNNWFCECENELVQYFARNEVTLSEEVYCSEPEKCKNINLRQVVEECAYEDTTTATLITSTSTITAEKTIYTESATNEVLTSTMSTSTSYETINTTMTTNANLTNSTPISNETLTTITTKTINSTISNPTSFETLPTTTENMTAISSTTFKSSQTTTVELVHIECDNRKTDTSWRLIVKQKVNISLKINSSRSLTLTVKASKFVPNSFIIYFTTYRNFTYTAEVKLTNYIDGLKPATAYVFCLAVGPAFRISPFDCQSIYTDSKVYRKKWLLESDKIWFISLISTVTILLVLVFVLATYKILRNHPNWLLKRNQQPHQAKYAAGKVVLTKGNSSIESQSSSNSSGCDRSVYLNSLPALQNCNEKDEQIDVYYSQHHIPLARAPNVPPSVELCKQIDKTSCSVGVKCKTAFKNCSPANGDYLDIIDNDPDYQTIDYYETINN